MRELHVTMNAFHQSAVTFSSQNYGAGKYDRCDKALILSALTAMTLGESLGLTFRFFGVPLLKMYTSDPLVIEAGLVRMDYLFRVQALNGLMDIMVGGLRGIGFSMIPTMVSLTGVCALRLIWMSTVFKAYPTTAMLYLVYPVTWTITTSAHIVTYLIGRNRLRKQVNIVDNNQ